MTPEQEQRILELFNRHFGQLVIYAEAILRDRSRAEDIVQDAFHEAVKQIDVVMAHPNPDGWLREVVKNKLGTSERSRRRYIKRFLSMDTELPVEIAASDPPLEDLIQLEQDNPLDKIRRALGEEEWYLLKRLTLDKASHLVVAQELHITVWACQKRLERVRKKLYEVFPEQKRKGKKKFF